MNGFFKISLILFAMLFCFCACSSGSGALKSIDDICGSYGDVKFEKAEILEDYQFENDIFTQMKEAALHASTDAIIGGKITAVDEIAATVQYPVKKIIPAEESTTGFEQVITEYYPVTAYLRLITLQPTNVFYDSTERVKSDSVRILTRSSSRKWDDLAIPLEEGDECILYLQDADDDGDILKVYDRNVASFVLYDSANGVIKKTKDGWVHSDAHEFIAKDSESYTLKLGLGEHTAPEIMAGEEFNGYYENANSFIESISHLYLSQDPLNAIINNVRYYYEK